MGFFTLELPTCLSLGHRLWRTQYFTVSRKSVASPDASVSQCDGAGVFFLDAMYLATEIVLENTAGPTTVSQPHFLPQGLAGVAVPSKPNQSHSLGFFQLKTQENKAPFSLS